MHNCHLHTKIKHGEAEFYDQLELLSVNLDSANYFLDVFSQNVQSDKFNAKNEFLTVHVTDATGSRTYYRGVHFTKVSVLSVGDFIVI